MQKRRLATSAFAEEVAFVIDAIVWLSSNTWCTVDAQERKTRGQSLCHASALTLHFGRLSPLNLN